MFGKIFGPLLATFPFPWTVTTKNLQMSPGGKIAQVKNNCFTWNIWTTCLKTKAHPVWPWPYRPLGLHRSLGFCLWEGKGLSFNQCLMTSQREQISDSSKTYAAGKPAQVWLPQSPTLLSTRSPADRRLELEDVCESQQGHIHRVLPPFY
jgi:hypothetical protein